MQRFIQFTMVVLVFFVGGVAAVHAGGNVAPSHLALLMTYPDGSPCPAPCILGIRPGYTLRQQVPGLLRQHPFVQDNSSSLCLEQRGVCEFRLLGFDMKGQVLYGIDNKVIDVYLSLDLSRPGSRSLRMGDFISLFGVPDKLLPHYACCTPTQYDRTISWIDMFKPTYGFWFYFTGKGMMVQDYASVSNGIYQLRPDAPVLGIRVFNSIQDENAVIQNGSGIMPSSPWDRWYGFTSAGRYFLLARPETKTPSQSP